MTPASCAVVIPARNERELLPTCLAALGRQGVAGMVVVVVANDCTDSTADAARHAAARHGLILHLIERDLAPGGGVGLARRIGCAAAIAAYPGVAAILTSDADCRVADDWVRSTLGHLASVDVVCGRVVPDEAEHGILSAMDPVPGELEGRYEALVMAFVRWHRQGDPLGDHGGAAGASLGFRTTAYEAVGGFAPLRTGEDRDIVRRAKQAVQPVRHAGDVVVQASCRLNGRADGGMADALRARVDRTNYLIDDGLPPADWLIRAARGGTLGPWPLAAADVPRLRARDLRPEIACLERAMARLSLPNIPDRVSG